MRRDARFEFRLSADARRELDALALETGLSAADLARLGIRWMLEHPGVLLRRDAAENQPEGDHPRAA